MRGRSPAAPRAPPAQSGVPRGVDAVADAVGIEMLQHFVNALPVVVFPGVDGEAEPGLACLLEQRRVIAVVEIGILAAGDVDADNATMAVRDRLLDDDRVQRLPEGPVQAEDEPGLYRVLEEGSVEAPDGGHDDVVEIALAPAVSFHRVVAKLQRGDVRLSIGSTDD